MNTQSRHVISKTRGIAASDGAGVRLTRLIGSPELNFIDPFLMLDYFESDDPDDYIAGFPPHPHRGFETVTYLVAGKMRHKDNQGHEGVIEAGGVQWMTAGRGIIHSEMPEQENGLLKGFQLWVNLPSYAKMSDPSYQEFAPDQIPTEERENGAKVKVITGETTNNTHGPVSNKFVNPKMFDIYLDKNQTFHETLSNQANAFIYIVSGILVVKNTVSDTPVNSKELGLLSPGDDLWVEAKSDNTQFLLISAEPLNEAIARGGPFVMNTQEEVQQAFSDYRQGLF